MIVAVKVDDGGSERREVRAKAYLRQVRSPDLNAWHGAVDPRTWAALGRISARERATPAELLRAREVIARGRRDGRFLATLPRSGTNWLIALIESSINLHHGLDGDYDLVPDYFVSGDPGWKPRGHRHFWPASLQSVIHAVGTTPTVADPVILGGHYPIVRGTTDLAGSGRPAALVRDLVEAVESQIHKVHRDGSVAQIERVRSMAMESVGFVEHWQAMAARRGSDVLVLRFEDLVADPGTSLQRISDHWSLDLDASSIGTAIELSDRRRMTAKTGDDRTNVRVTIDVPVVDPMLAAVVRDVIRSSSLDGAFGYAPPED